MNAFFSTLLAQRDRWILWTPVPLALGIGIYFGLSHEPAAWMGTATLAVLCLALWPIRQNKVAVLGWLAVFLVVLGFAAGQVRTWRADTFALEKKTRVAVLLHGRVIDVDAMEKSRRVTLDSLAPAGMPLPQQVRVKLKNKDTAQPEAGDIVEVKAMLLPLSKPVLPGAFDFQQHAWFKGLGATGYAVSDLTIAARHGEGFFFERMRRAIRDKVYGAHLAKDNISALTVAFMTGDASGIADKDWETARQSGIAHLIAISGSHFIMIVGVMFFAVRAGLAAYPRAALRWPVKKIAAGAAIFSAVFYMLLIGAPIPAQRAAVMSSVIMLAIILDRDPLTLRLAALAAFVVLLIEPESLSGPSFQMSFSAVIGMIAFFESTKDWWRGHYREAGFIKRCGLVFLSCLMTTVVATVATAPFVLFHFLRAPFFSGLIANMIAVPLSSFVTFPAAMVACLLMPFGLEKAPLWVTQKSIEVIMRAAETVAGWPYMVVHADAWPVWCLGLLALGGLWVCLWQGRIRWLGLAAIGLAAITAALTPRADILVGGNFRLLAAVRDDTGQLQFSPGKYDAFIRTAWIDREGGEGSGLWPQDACDKRICTRMVKGKTIIFNKQSDFHPKPGEEIDLKMLEQDCAKADIIVLVAAKRPPFDCAATLIDKWDLYDDGAHAVYLDGSATRIVSVAAVRGVRPWTGKAYGKLKRENAARL